MATILVVDDHAPNRKFLVTLLEHEGHSMLEAIHGKDAVAMAKAHHPDLVITEVLMPVLDGYGLVKELRLDAATEHLPVVFYTAHYAERDARALARSCRVSAVLTKPAEPAEIITAVNRALARGVPSLPTEGLPEEFDSDHLLLVTDKLAKTADELRAANARLRALINVGLDVAQEPDLGRRLRRLSASTRSLFGATYVTIGVVDRHDGTVQQLVTCGVDGPPWMEAGDTVPGILGQALAKRRVVRGHNVGGEPAQDGWPRLHPAVETFLAAPIISAAHAYGWICLVGNDGTSFTDDDEELVTALAGQLGRILEIEHVVSARQQAEAEKLTERDRSDDVLRGAEARIRFALDAARVGIWDLEAGTGVLHWSDLLQAQHGVVPGNFAGTMDAYLACVHPEDRAGLLDTISGAARSGADFSVHYRVLWPDQSVHWIDGAGRMALAADDRPAGGLGIALDVTEYHLLQDQYYQAQKMDGLGRLAGGVAHDFNNLLTAILGYCELSLDVLGEAAPLRDYIIEIQKAGTSAAALTRELLTFSRKRLVEPTRLDLNTVVSGMRPLLGRVIREDVSIVLEPASAACVVLADRGQIEQIIINLAINARDAMALGGRLSISTAHVELDGSSASGPRVTPGPYACLRVTDNGAGMTPQVMARALEPFFTTKTVGKGTGLGLAIVHGIVAQGGGAIAMHSDPGQGTNIEIYLPRLDAEPDPPAPPATAQPASGGETVLIVDDDDAVRRLAGTLLGRLGYRVLLAGNAGDALQRLKQDGPVDLVLTDVVMPGVSGPDLVELINREVPTLPVIYMSGYPDDVISGHGVMNQGIAFLHKPFTQAVLSRKVRETLDRLRAERTERRREDEEIGRVT